MSEYIFYDYYDDNRNSNNHNNTNNDNGDNDDIQKKNENSMVIITIIIIRAFVSWSKFLRASSTLAITCIFCR